ncbi:MAG: YfiR family protein [Thermoanaerobaculia bacterium]
MNFNVVLISFLFIFQPFQVLYSLGEEVKEYDLKAAFLYHFTKYFEWQGLEEIPFFEIDILGESEILEPLKEIAEKKLVFGKPLKVKKIETLKQIDKPQIIFISKFSKFEISGVLKKTENLKTLIVGEEEGLCLQGVAVNFVIRDGNLRFEINERALKIAGIKPSSQIMKLAVSLFGNRE